MKSLKIEKNCKSFLKKMKEFDQFINSSRTAGLYDQLQSVQTEREWRILDAVWECFSLAVFKSTIL